MDFAVNLESRMMAWQKRASTVYHVVLHLPTVMFAAVSNAAILTVVIGALAWQKVKVGRRSGPLVAVAFFLLLGCSGGEKKTDVIEFGSPYHCKIERIRWPNGGFELRGKCRNKNPAKAGQFICMYDERTMLVNVHTTNPDFHPIDCEGWLDVYRYGIDAKRE